MMVFWGKPLGIIVVMHGTFSDVLVQCGVFFSYLKDHQKFSFNICTGPFFFETWAIALVITEVKDSAMSTFLFLFLLLNWILFFTFGSLFFILAEGKERYSQFFHKVYDHGKQWLDCVQRRLGLPYWFLCFVLMLSFFLITWVCCSSCDDDCREKETAKVSETVFVFSNESRYSRMHQVKF